MNKVRKKRSIKESVRKRDREKERKREREREKERERDVKNVRVSTPVRTLKIAVPDGCENGDFSEE